MWLAEMSSAESGSVLSCKAYTLSLHLTKSSCGLSARALNPATALPCAPHIDRAHTYIFKDGPKGLRARLRGRNSGATRRGDHGKARDQRLRSEFCTPVFPFPVQGTCGLRDGRRRTRKGAASCAARLEHHMVEQLAAAAPHPTLSEGLSNELRTALIFRGRMAAGTSVPYFASRSWIRNRGAAPKRKRLPQLLDNQQLVGCFVMLKCKIRRRSCLITKKQ